MRLTRTTLTLLVSAAVAGGLAGCGSDGKERSATTAAPVASDDAGPTVPITPPAAEATLTVAPVATEAVLAPDVVALAVSARADAPAVLTALELEATGGVDEALLGGLRVVADLDADGAAGPGDALLGELPGPAFTVDDGRATVVFEGPLPLEGAPTILVTVDAAALGQAALDRAGQTLALGLTAGGVAPVDSDTPLPNVRVVDGPRDPIALAAHDHLLITEVVPGGAGTSRSPTRRPARPT